jgi:putative ABC transport system permease protein
MIYQDFRYALRLLAKKPGFTILTTMVMATGIGLSVFLFSFFHTLLYKDLPFKDSDTLIRMSGSLNGVRIVNGIDLHDYEQIRTSLKGISEFGAYKSDSVNVSVRDGVRRYSATYAEPNFFEMTRTQPILGRDFSVAENQVGAENVVVIGFDIWQNHFAGDGNVLDEILRINGENHRIIGVMPQGYFFPNTAELWIPIREDAAQLSRGKASDVVGIAHLAEGVSMQDIDQQLVVIMQRIEGAFPKTNSGIGAYVTTIPGAMMQTGQAIVASSGIVSILILLLASINVGNLLLSRAVERSQETAIRVALGAPRSRLISQMLWESIIICTVGGVIGLLVVSWGLEVTESITDSFGIGKQAFWWKLGVDRFTLGLFFSFMLGTIVVTGLLPAWKNSGGDFNAVLRDGTRGALGKKSGRMNRLLVISEIFVSMTVLIAAGVMVVSSYLQTHADTGANTENIVTAEIMLSKSSYDTEDKQVGFFKTLQSRLENSIGVGDVMFSSALPGVAAATPMMALEGKEYTQDRGYPRANYIVVMPGTLAKLDVELLKGRNFNSSDEGLENKTAIVTKSFVSTHFPDESPLGKRIRLIDVDDDKPDWVTIVGVVEHTRQGRDKGAKAPSVFRPFTQVPRDRMTVAIEMRSDRATVVRNLRKTLHSIDPELPAFNVEDYGAKLMRFTAPIRFISTVFLLFGIAAVVLAASGIYGVMSNTIDQRAHEIGVKRALGANEQDITRELLRSGFKQLLWGCIPGLLAGCGMGFAISRTMEVGNTELAIISLTITAIIAAVVMLATYLPTRKILRLEPSQALHYE